MWPAVEGEGNHGNGPAPQSNSGEIFALSVYISDETRRHVIVTSEVKVLNGVHDEVLKSVEGEVRGKEMQSNHGPVEVADVRIARLTGVDDSIVDVMTEASTTNVNILDEQSEHGGGLAGQPERNRAVLGRVFEAVGKEGRRGT